MPIYAVLTGSSQVAKTHLCVCVFLSGFFTSLIHMYASIKAKSLPGERFQGL